MRRAVLLVWILCWPLSGQSQFLDGNALMTACTGTGKGEPRDSVPRYNKCVRYLTGVSDATEAWQDLGFIEPKRVCIPEDLDSEQLRQAFVAYMRQRTGQWRVTAGSLAVGAFLSAWPCNE